MIDRRDWLRRTAALVTGAAAAGLGRADAQQRGDGSAYLFPGFKSSKAQTSGATVNLVIGGSAMRILAVATLGTVASLAGSRTTRLLVGRMGDRGDLETVLRLVEDGTVAPVVDSIVGLDQAPDAFRRLLAREIFGKVVVAMSDPSNVLALDDIRTLAGREVAPVVATATDIVAAISRIQRLDRSVESFTADMQAVEVKSPMEATMRLSEVNFCARAADSFGSPLLSPTTMTSGRPLTPPAALIHSKARSMDRWNCCPYSA